MCPDCGNDYVCQCAACARRRLEAGQVDQLPWLTIVDDEDTPYQMCPKCGLTKTIDEWFDIQFMQYKRQQEMGGYKGDGNWEN